MQHHDDVGAEAQRLGVAGLLVAAVAAVALVHERVQAEPPGDLDGVVVARVVGDHDRVHEVQRDLAVGLLDRARGVVGRHHDDDLLAVEHGRLLNRGAV